MDFTVTSRLPALDGSDQQSFSISNLFLIFLSLTPPFLSSLLTDDLNSYPQRKLKLASGKSFFFFFNQSYKSPFICIHPSHICSCQQEFSLCLSKTCAPPSVSGSHLSYCLLSHFIRLFSLNRSFSLDFKLAESSLLLKQETVKNPSPFAPCLFPSTVVYHSFP